APSPEPAFQLDPSLPPDAFVAREGRGAARRKLAHVEALHHGATLILRARTDPFPFRPRGDSLPRLHAVSIGRHSNDLRLTGWPANSPHSSSPRGGGCCAATSVHSVRLPARRLSGSGVRRGRVERGPRPSGAACEREGAWSVLWSAAGLAAGSAAGLATSRQAAGAARLNPGGSRLPGQAPKGWLRFRRTPEVQTDPARTDLY